MDQETSKQNALDSVDHHEDPIDDDDDPIMNVLLAQAYEESSQSAGFREDQDYQKAIELSLLSAPSTSTIPTLTSPAAPPVESGPLNSTLFDEVLAEQEQVRHAFSFDQKNESIDEPPKLKPKARRSEPPTEPTQPPEVIVLSDGVFSCTVAPGEYFDAVWDLRIKETSKESRAEWGREGILLQPWGTRTFAPSDCGMSCIHQVKIEVDDQVIVSEEDRSQSKSPSVASLNWTVRPTSSGLTPNSTSPGKKGEWRTIRLKRLHLRAPLEQGEYEEVWRLRQKKSTLKDCNGGLFGNYYGSGDGLDGDFPFSAPFGDLFFIRIKVDASPSRSLIRGLTAPVDPITPLYLRYTLLSQGLRNPSPDQGEIPEVVAGVAYDYLFTLRNDGNQEWPTGLQIARLDGSPERELDLKGKGVANEEVHLVVTDGKRRLLCKPLPVGGTARVILSGLRAPRLDGTHEERWRLFTRVRSEVVEIGEPLTSRIKVVGSTSPPPSFEQALEPPAFEEVIGSNEDADWTMVGEGSQSEASNDGFSLISSRRSSFEKMKED